MEVTERTDFEQQLKGSGFHVLTFAETGFAMLNQYCREYGLDNDTIENFSRTVNQRDESGSLHPVAPISAVPRRFIRDSHAAQPLTDQIIDFLRANQAHIGARNILFDFRAGIKPFVITACRNALADSAAQNLDQVIIINTINKHR